MDYSITGCVRPKFEPNGTKVKAEGFGWRKSAHQFWTHAVPDEHILPDDWPVEVSIFFEKLVIGFDNARIKVCVASPSGKIVEEIFVDPLKSHSAEEKLADMVNEEFNLLFDPVPWVKGKRLKVTCFGFGAVTNGHPFEYFPEPCIFWGVGVKAFQFLVPWHEPRKIRESTEILRDVGTIYDRSFRPMKDDLLVVPGSIIFSPALPPFTAEVLFDAFSTTEAEGHDRMWTKY